VSSAEATTVTKQSDRNSLPSPSPNLAPPCSIGPPNPALQSISPAKAPCASLRADAIFLAAIPRSPPPGPSPPLLRVLIGAPVGLAPAKACRHGESCLPGVRQVGAMFVLLRSAQALVSMRCVCVCACTCVYFAYARLIRVKSARAPLQTSLSLHAPTCTRPHPKCSHLAARARASRSKREAGVGGRGKRGGKTCAPLVGSLEHGNGLPQNIT